MSTGRTAAITTIAGAGMITRATTFTALAVGIILSTERGFRLASAMPTGPVVVISVTAVSGSPMRVITTDTLPAAAIISMTASGTTTPGGTSISMVAGIFTSAERGMTSRKPMFIRRPAVTSTTVSGGM